MKRKKETTPEDPNENTQNKKHKSMVCIQSELLHELDRVLNSTDSNVKEQTINRIINSLHQRHNRFHNKTFEIIQYLGTSFPNHYDVFLNYSLSNLIGFLNNCSIYYRAKALSQLIEIFRNRKDILINEILNLLKSNCVDFFPLDKIELLITLSNVSNNNPYFKKQAFIDSGESLLKAFFFHNAASWRTSNILLHYNKTFPHFKDNLFQLILNHAQNKSTTANSKVTIIHLIRLTIAYPDRKVEIFEAVRNFYYRIITSPEPGLFLDQDEFSQLTRLFSSDAQQSVLAEILKTHISYFFHNLTPQDCLNMFLNIKQSFSSQLKKVDTILHSHLPRLTDVINETSIEDLNKIKQLFKSRQPLLFRLIKNELYQILTQDQLIAARIAHKLLILIPEMNAEYFKLIVKKIDQIFPTLSSSTKKHTLKYIFKYHPQYQRLLKKPLGEIKIWIGRASQYEIEKNTRLFLQGRRGQDNSNHLTRLPCSIGLTITSMTGNPIYHNFREAFNIAYKENEKRYTNSSNQNA